MSENIPNQNSNPPLNHSSSPMDDDLNTPEQQSVLANLYNPNPTPATPTPIKPPPPPPPPPPKKEPIMDISQIKSSIHGGKKSTKWLVILIIVILLIATPVLSVLLTESGAINWGIDRLYAKTPIPEVFGGISADTKTAITKSLAATNNIQAFDFKAENKGQIENGTILNNKNYQYFLNSDDLKMEVRRVNDEIFYTTKNTPDQWTKVTPEDKEYWISDILSTSTYLNPYKVLDIAQQHVSNSSFRAQIASNKISVYKVNFTSELSKEEIQKQFDSIGSDVALTEADVDPFNVAGEVQITLYINKNYILDKAEVVFKKYSDQPISVEYSVSRKTNIKKPAVEQINDLDNAISSSQKQARDARRRSDLQLISHALQNYANENNGQYPLTTLNGPSNSPAPTLAEAARAEIISITPLRNIIENILVPDYMTALPRDPSTPKYYYSYISGGYHFRIYAVSESSSDEKCAEKFGSHCFMSEAW